MKNNKSSSRIGTVIIFMLTILGIMSFTSACSSGSDEYNKTLESGMQKYYSGDDMSKEEYNAVNGFLDWKDKQTNKTYDEWDN